MDGFQVVICGGGVAAIEGLLRLRSLAGDRVEVTLLAPNEDLTYRPIAVNEATGVGWTRTYQLWDLARDIGADWDKDELASIDASAVVCAGRGPRARV